MSSPLSFVLFGLLVAVLYQLVLARTWRPGILLTANLVFLGSYSEGARGYLPLAGFLVVGYLGVRLIQAVPRSAGLVIGIMLAGFVWLKKYAFLPDSAFLSFPYVTIGLSYILFRVLHLMIVAATGTLPEAPSVLTYFEYTSHFLTLSSGPIQHYSDYLKTRTQAFSRRVTFPEVAAGIERVVLGLFKISVLSLVFSTIHNRALDSLTGAETPVGRAAAGIVLLASYPFFLYSNFSGYIDIVIGTGRLFGFVFPENFNRPFSAEDFMSFWNRWHITLSAWLKAYVYNPLLVFLMRMGWPRWVETSLGVLAFFVTFFLVGIWHGRTAEFLLYGITLGFGVSMNKTFQLVLTHVLGRKKYARVSSAGLYAAAARGLTFTYFTVTLVLFWSNLVQIRMIVSELGGPSCLAVIAAIFIASAILLATWERVRPGLMEGSWKEVPLVSQFVRVALGAALLASTLAIGLLMHQSAPDIVYKAF